MSDSARLHFTGIPVFKTELAPLTKLERKGKEIVRVPVLYTITEIPGETKRILVHPDKWELFMEGLEAAGVKTDGL